LICSFPFMLISFPAPPLSLSLSLSLSQFLPFTCNLLQSLIATFSRHASSSQPFLPQSHYRFSRATPVHSSLFHRFRRFRLVFSLYIPTRLTLLRLQFAIIRCNPLELNRFSTRDMIGIALYARARVRVCRARSLVYTRVRVRACVNVNVSVCERVCVCVCVCVCVRSRVCTFSII